MNVVDSLVICYVGQLSINLKVLSNITPRFLTWVEYLMSFPLLLIGGVDGKVVHRSDKTLGEYRVLQDGDMNGLSELKLRKFDSL